MSVPTHYSKAIIEILVVEDSPTQAAQLKYLLERNGFKVTVAENGKKALAILSGWKPTLIISDIVMPEMDGYELCKRIKSDGGDQDIAVILLTSLANPEDVLEGLACGADNFITKPYSKDYLLANIEQILANRKLRADRRVSIGVEIHFAGKRRFITADQQQMLSLLLSTYDAAVHKNKELIQTQDELRALNDRLEDLVAERTASLTAEIEERKRAEIEKEKLEEQLQQSQKMESIGRLAGGIAHDFNNLLQIINSYAELSIIKLPTEDPLFNNIDNILKAGEKAAGLTRQLLAFSRKQVLRPVILDINKTISGMEKILHRLIGEDIDIVNKHASNLGKVKADPGQIEQVLMNLVINARDAMPNGGKLTIETANVELDETYATQHVAVTPGPYVMLAVTDTGCGMDEQTRTLAFEPFFTTKEQGKGTGLGLSTVYGIVKQSGGNIWIYSEPGRGTTFKIYLPRQTPDAEEEPLDKPVILTKGGTETILVVEDEVNVRNLVERVLTLAGYTVIAFENPNEALLACQQLKVDIHLILTDVIMPGMNGKQLVEKLSLILPKVKVLYTSGYTDNAIVHHGVLDHETQFISKPFTVSALTRKIREVLDR